VLGSLYSDLALSHQANPRAFDRLEGARVFVTGGTGFFGTWLLHSVLWANQELALGLRVTVLSRDPAAFLKRRPEFQDQHAIRFETGDVRDFACSGRETFTHAIHAGTAASATMNEESPLLMFSTIVDGTRRLLEFARSARIQRVLFTSSGAVYGRQPASLLHVPETYTGGPDPLLPTSAYGEGKRVAEMLCATYSRTYGIEATIGRFFAFAGPFLPLDSTYAIGNFLQDATLRRPLLVRSDGTALRSYLYGADMVMWLWCLLGQGRTENAYNVGSDRAVSIESLASIVAQEVSLTLKIPKSEVTVLGKAVPGASPERYVPENSKIRGEFNVRESVTLEEGIRRMARWADERLRNEKLTR
jgi:nucleoside-diphosphate-sugar epimerase